MLRGQGAPVQAEDRHILRGVRSAAPPRPSSKVDGGLRSDNYLRAMATDGQSAGTAVDIWRKRVAASQDRVAYRYRQGNGWQGMTWGQADGAAREIAAGL